MRYSCVSGNNSPSCLASSSLLSKSLPNGFSTISRNQLFGELMLWKVLQLSFSPLQTWCAMHVSYKANDPGCLVGLCIAKHLLHDQAQPALWRTHVMEGAAA